MAKYYVQSGTLRTIVQAETPRKAALWAVHQAMQQVLPIDDSDRQSPESKSQLALSTGIGVMDEVVQVSERGFGSSDVQSLATMEVVGQWNEMFAALDRLQKMLSQGHAD